VIATGVGLVRKTYGNQWDIPGGHVDAGESPAAACHESCAKNSASTGSPSGFWS
jgi:8-oxo-dGTP diphosphatase